jgi:O-antigen/teichoic acid export membrane protein
MALQTVFASGLAEAYVKDPGCLPRLTESLYKILILLSLPLASFGAFYAPQAVVLFYGKEMSEAGWVASAFCFVHLLPLIATPLAMAVGVKEKVKEFLPLLYLRVGVNLVLDWLLIPHFGILGALAAVVLTFALTFPFRLDLIRSVLGGFYFPWPFFLRFLVAGPALAAAVWFLVPKVNIPGLLAVSLAYLVLFVLLLRFASLLRHEDVAELRALDFKKLNRLLDLLAGPAK